MKKTKAHITVTSILTVLSPEAECAWDDSRKWQKISQLYEDKSRIIGQNNNCKKMHNQNHSTDFNCS